LKTVVSFFAGGQTNGISQFNVDSKLASDWKEPGLRGEEPCHRGKESGLRGEEPGLRGEEPGLRGEKPGL